MPANWLDSEDKDVVQELNKKTSEENLRKLAGFYKSQNRYPSMHSHEPEERRLGNWLMTKRLAKKGLKTCKLYPGEEQLGIELGLPANWLDSEDKIGTQRLIQQPMPTNPELQNYQSPSYNSILDDLKNRGYPVK